MTTVTCHQRRAHTTMPTATAPSSCAACLPCAGRTTCHAQQPFQQSAQRAAQLVQADIGTGNVLQKRAGGCTCQSSHSLPGPTRSNEPCCLLDRQYTGSDHAKCRLVTDVSSLLLTEGQTYRESRARCWRMVTLAWKALMRASTRSWATCHVSPMHHEPS